MAAHRLGGALGLRHAGAELDGAVAVAIAGALRHNLHVLHWSTVTGTCRPSSRNSRVIPSFFAITPERIFYGPLRA